MIKHLEQIIAARKAEQPDGSYTVHLLTEGQDRILRKLAEEAGETIIASKNNSRDELIHETSDLLYHLLVLLAYHDLSWSDIEAELARRHTLSRE